MMCLYLLPVAAIEMKKTLTVCVSSWKNRPDSYTYPPNVITKEFQGQYISLRAIRLAGGQERYHCKGKKD